jgi:hypothetical protein
MNLKYGVGAASVLLALGSCLAAAAELQLTGRTQVLKPDATGHNQWEVATALKSLKAEEAATLAGGEKATMAGKGRQMARKPATKFAHLRKKMEKNRVVSKIGKQKGSEGRPNHASYR